MKNKALTYVLLLVVGVIWYQVFFRVKNNLTADETNIPQPNQSLASVRIISRDTIDLNVDYRDPFRYEKMARPVTSSDDVSRSSRGSHRVQRIPTKPEFVWPKVTYHGLIRNRESTAPLGLIRVDGMVYNLRIGDEIFNEIYVKSIEKDELVVRYKKLTTAFYKN